MTADTDFDILTEANTKLAIRVVDLIRSATPGPTDHELMMMLNDIYWWALMIRQKGTTERDRFNVRMAHHIMHGVAQHTQEEYFATHPEEAIPEEYRQPGAVDTPAGA